MEFFGVNLDVADSRLRSDADHWLIPDWPTYLQRLAAVTAALPEGDLKLTASIWLDYAVRDQASGQAAGFIAAWDLTHSAGPNFTTYAATPGKAPQATPADVRTSVSQLGQAQAAGSRPGFDE